MFIKDTQTLKFPTNTFETLEAEIAVTEYPDKNFADLVPVRQVPANTETLASLTVDYRGKAKPVSGIPGEALPKIDFSASKDTISVLDFGFAYDITQPDLRATANGNLDVLRTKLEAGSFVERSTLYDMAIEGNADMGVLGLKNIDVPSSDVPATARFIPATSAQDMVNSFMAGFNAVAVQTQNTRTPDTVVMPIKVHQALTGAVFGDSGRTALGAIQESVTLQAGRPIRIVVNSSFTNDILFYQYAPDVLRMYMAQPLTYFTPQPTDLGWKVPAMFRFSPIQMRFRPAFHRLTKVLTAT
ncbi:MAG: DUF2184 domain-containing protein [Gammaproteobacteria bacterium]|nr:DUF2184 domain-containing protein [Gammaproteobacteria bacterium]